MAPDLVFFGDLARVRSAPVTESFDESGGSLVLSEDATIEVPPSAFDTSTELTGAVIDLAFEDYAENAPTATIYRMSTAVDGELTVPVVLEVGIPSEEVRTVEFVGGEWLPIDVPAGETTRIEIRHFSDVTIAVVESSDEPSMFKKPADPQAQAAGDFLNSCVFAVLMLLHGDDAERSPAEEEPILDAASALNLGLSFCTRALIDKFSPSGVRVEVSCVGEKIEDGNMRGEHVSLEQAIEACVAEDQRANDAASDEAVPTETAAAPEPSAPADGSASTDAGDHPRTYRGDGVHYLTAFVYDIRHKCVTEGPMELTLAADGTATFTYSNGVGVTGTLSDDDTPQIECEQRPGNTWTGTYDAGLSTFEILPPAPEGTETWDIGGIYDADTADVLGGYSLPANQPGQQTIVEIEASLTLR